MTPLRILFISPLDRRVVPNTREQNMAQACRAIGHTTLSLTLAQNTSRAGRDIVRDTLSWRTHGTPEDGVLCIDPPLNPCTGLHTNLAPSPQARQTTLRARVIGFLAPLGVLRDAVIIPVFLLHALWRGRFDLCIAYGPWAACVGWLLRAMGRVQVLVYDDQDFEPAIMRNPVRQRWAIFLECTMMRRADAVVSVGERLAALRRVQTGCPVSVIPNGVRDIPGTPGLHPRAWPVVPAATPELTLIYVGNVVPWSGLDAVLNALAEVHAQDPGIRMLIVGDGLPSYVQSLHHQVDTLGLRTVVTFVGRVPNTAIGPWLAQADVGLALFRPEPYRRYAFPLKVVEYMQAGLAVLGTQDTETEDIVRRHDIGMAIPFSVPAMADAMRALLHAPAQRQRFQNNAQRGAAQYSWASLTEQELALAGQALASRAPARRAR
ncbi:MAG: glycosyltransferase family 4 protein [Burkholderiales bacterium]|nr:glycosyltransferase family 4 protein [Burkholderiales bacterium]